ncbi:barstar family protein [Streptomyces sp. NPDC090054]|uniref:barstar family protein n=1 Tax=Streptomyces sp. NPDC090054 TaxID=3365933 RepID=UPI00381E1DE3
MIVGMWENNGVRRGRMRYRLTDTENDRSWGSCYEVEGLFGEPVRETYELFGWAPESPGEPWRSGGRVWLVPQDTALGPWLLEDVEGLGPHPGTDGPVLTGTDDYEGPPLGYRGPVRLHDEYRLLGGCREFARVLRVEEAQPLLVLRGFAPGEAMRQVLAKGTRRALTLGEAELEIRDDLGDRLTERYMWPTVGGRRPSSLGADLIDMELDLDGSPFAVVPAHARPVWDRWRAGPPRARGAWVGLGTRQRDTWLDLVRERGCRPAHHDRSGGAYELDGRHVTDVPGLYLALGEAVNGPGGYFGGCLDAVADCLRGGFGHAAGPSTLLWRGSATAHEHLSHVLAPDGHPYDLVAEVLGVLSQGGMRVAFA